MSQTRFEILILGTAQDGGYPHVGCTNRCCEDARQDSSLKKYNASIALIDHMYKKIAEFIDTAEAGQLREELEATQSELTYETEVRDETYLAAFKQGEEHLKEMLPKIQAMNMQQILLKKKKVFSEKFFRKH